jgi:hypothetical protein
MEISSVAIGGAMGHLQPKPNFLSTKYNCVLKYDLQKLDIWAFIR